jgi:phage/plasmid-like protein (TIGR03299 family)
MAHNLHYNEQASKYSFFSVKEKPWHGLGQVVSDYPTSAEAIQHAGLDYRVEKRKLFTYDSANAFGNADTIRPTIEVPHTFATVRTDNDAVLGVVGREYGVVQNRDAFSFFDSLTCGEAIRYETAGALGKGERIFITARMPEYIKIGRDDLVEQYLFLTTSHDGLGSIMAAFTPIRIVCNNTLTAAYNNCSNAIRIRHTGTAKEKLEQAQKVMGHAHKQSAYLEAVLNQWTKVRITDSQLLLLIQQALAPNKETFQQVAKGAADTFSMQFRNVCNQVFAYAQTSPTQQTEETKGTLYGSYNAITGYYQNLRSYRDEETKLRSLLLGGVAQVRTEKAFRLCNCFAKDPALLPFMN